MTDRPCFCALHVTVPCARNLRTRSADQARQIAASIRRSGFTGPVLIAEDNTIVAGHSRVPAAQEMAMDVVPCPRLAGLPDAQRRAYSVADNSVLVATGCRQCCPEMTGPSRRGGLVGVIRRTYTLLRGDFFAFRFVSDFHARQHIDSIDQFFPD